MQLLLHYWHCREKQFLSKLTRLGSQKTEESWDSRKTTGNFVLKFQASWSQQSSREKSPRLSSSLRWDSPARHSQPECCLGHGGLGRDVGTAAVWVQLLWSGTQNPSPDQHPGLPLLHKHAFEHLLWCLKWDCPWTWNTPIEESCMLPWGECSALLKR